RYYFRSSPCTVVLKKLKDPSTFEYMLVEPTSICDRCLSNVLKNEFSNWTSGNSQIDKFIQDAQRGFGAVYFAKWDKGVKCFFVKDKDKYHTRSEPCAVALKQLKSEKDSVHLFLKEVQAQFDCCHLYGVTQDPSTSQYMFVMRYAPQGDLGRFLKKKFDKLSLKNKLSIAQSICAELQNIHAKDRNSRSQEGCQLDPRQKKFKILTSSGYLEELTFNEYKSVYFLSSLNEELVNELKNSNSATEIYNIMKWKPDIPIHKDAVYKSRMISTSDKYMTSRNMALQYEICDIP
ncbi:18792_t:CDS:2, partial [Dentiscutata erythropus]